MCPRDPRAKKDIWNILSKKHCRCVEWLHAWTIIRMQSFTFTVIVTLRKEHAWWKTLMPVSSGGFSGLFISCDHRHFGFEDEEPTSHSIVQLIDDRGLLPDRAFSNFKSKKGHRSKDLSELNEICDFITVKYLVGWDVSSFLIDKLSRHKGLTSLAITFFGDDSSQETIKSSRIFLFQNGEEQTVFYRIITRGTVFRPTLSVKY